MPVLKDLSSALRLCGVPASRLVTVTLSPTFTLSLSGLNLKFWMVMVWDPAPLDEDAFLLEEPPPQAPTVRTRAAKRDSNGRGWRNLRTGTSEVNSRTCCHIHHRIRRRTRHAVVIEELQEASDGTLVLAIARYQQRALAEAYRRHGGAVFALARRLLGDQALAEEVVQEVFLRLWTQPDRFDAERGTLRSFLLAQSHGRAVDLLRSETSRRRREEREARQAAEAGYDIEREVLDLAMGDHVKQVLERLPAEERRVIELAYFGGLTYREVATKLDQPEGTVKSRIRAGLRRMRSDLVDVGIGGAWTES